MQQELRVDHMLSLSEEAAEITTTSEISPIDKKDEQADEEEMLDAHESVIQKIKPTKKETLPDLKPAEFKDEVSCIEEEIVAPNYFDLMSDDYEAKKLEDEFVAQLQKDIEASSEKEDEEELIEYEYEEMNTFLKNTATQEDFFEKVFDLVCAEKENFGRILYDDDKRITYLEKNFFATSVARAISKKDKYKFERDFILGDSSDFFNGKKISAIVEAMNSANVFEKIDKAGYIFNMLFMSEERENVCYQGWFVCMPVGGYSEMDDFVNYYSESVSVISSAPREIARTAKRYTNVIILY